jgi:hypothetical protein
MGVKISSLTLKTPLSGSEELEINDGGTTRKVTSQSIADLASAGAGITRNDVDTAPGFLTLDWLNQADLIFVGNSSFSTSRTVLMTNAAFGKRFTFIFVISDVAATITFPGNFKMKSSLVTWDSGTQTWESDFSTGEFKAYAIFDGTSWIMDISESDYV